MEIKQLEAFIHVAELGSFTRASTILDTTQPALSRLVRQLEVDLRQHLLTRNGRGVTLTDAGQVLLAHAKGIVEQVERARQNLDELRGAVGGNFGIGLLPSIAKMTASKTVRRLHEAFPEAKISIAEALSTTLIEWLLMGRIDAAVLYDTSYTPLVEKRPLFDQELFLVGPAATSAKPRSISFGRIGKYKLITPNRTHVLRHTIEGMAAELGTKLSIALEIDSIPSILDLVSDGFGYAILPASAVMTDPLKRGFSITRLRDPTPVMRLVLATSRRHALSRLAIKSIEMVESDVMTLCREEFGES